MKFYSLFKKAVNLTTINWLNRNNAILPGLYLFNLPVDKLKTSNRMLFHFNSNEYMHLGDHLFFLPLVKSFILSGYQVEVAPTKIMQPLFEKLSIPLAKEPVELDKYDLIISRIEMVRRLSKYRALLVNVSKNLTMPICDQLITNFSKFFNLEYPPKIDYTIFKKPGLINYLKLDLEKKIILFNLYCDSAAYLINQHKVNLLINLVREYANKPGYQVVLVGSSNDKENSKYKLDFPYFDLRGKTSVIDIFSLVNCENVYCYIGFDAFVMHVFSLLEKPSFVVFRGRIHKSQHDMLKSYHINLFNNDAYVTLLN